MVCCVALALCGWRHGGIPGRMLGPSLDPLMKAGWSFHGCPRLPRLPLADVHRFSPALSIATLSLYGQVRLLAARTQATDAREGEC